MLMNNVYQMKNKKSTNKFKNKWDTVFKKKRLSRTRKFISYNKFIMVILLDLMMLSGADFSHLFK